MLCDLWFLAGQAKKNPFRVDRVIDYEAAEIAFLCVAVKKSLLKKFH